MYVPSPIAAGAAAAVVAGAAGAAVTVKAGAVTVTVGAALSTIADVEVTVAVAVTVFAEVADDDPPPDAAPMTIPSTRVAGATTQRDLNHGRFGSGAVGAPPAPMFDPAKGGLWFGIG